MHKHEVEFMMHKTANNVYFKICISEFKKVSKA